MPVKKAIELERFLTIEEADDNFSLLHGPPAGTLIISGGIITVDGAGWYLIDGEGTAADTLDRINGTTIGDIVRLSIVDASRWMTIAHGANLRTWGGQSFVMDSIYDTVIFLSFGSDVLAQYGRNSCP